MEDTEITPISKLRPYIKAEKIKARVCRIWKSTIPGTTQKHTCLHCILLDETKHAVQGFTSDIDYETTASKIEPGGCYEITNFRTTKMKSQYNVVPHETQLIFTGKTNFKKLSDVFPHIPRHRFFLQDYNTLYPRLNKVDILTDVIGHLTAIQHLEPKQINQRVAYKCDIHIQNVRREQLTVTLWEDIAENFCSSSVQALPLPIVMVLTSLKVELFRDKIVMNSTGCSLFFFDPDIPEVNAYKSVFANCNEPVKILAPSSTQVNEAEILRTAKMFTIDEVAFLDPDLHKNDTFFCKACIKCFDTRYQWWYSACPNCVKQMHKDLTTGQLICQKHPNQIPTPWYKVNLVLEDHTNEINALIIGKSGEKLFGLPCKDLVLNQRLIDQQQLPNEFLRLIGQRKIFHLRFGNRKSNFTSTDILIYNVSEDTSIEPITPQPLSRQITVSSTTMSSSASMPETTGSSYKRKRDSIRKALFTTGEHSELEEISEIDPEEFDEIPIKSLKKKSSLTDTKTATTSPKKD